VKKALISEGWQITHDPYRIDVGFTDLYIDLGAKRMIYERFFKYPFIQKSINRNRVY